MERMVVVLWVALMFILLSVIREIQLGALRAFHRTVELESFCGGSSGLHCGVADLLLVALGFVDRVDIDRSSSLLRQLALFLSDKLHDGRAHLRQPAQPEAHPDSLVAAVEPRALPAILVPCRPQRALDHFVRVRSEVCAPVRSEVAHGHLVAPSRPDRLPHRLHREGARDERSKVSEVQGDRPLRIAAGDGDLVADFDAQQLRLIHAVRCHELLRLTKSGSCFVRLAGLRQLEALADAVEDFLTITHFILLSAARRSQNLSRFSMRTICSWPSMLTRA